MPLDLHAVFLTDGVTVYLSKTWTGLPLICQIWEKPSYLSRGQIQKDYFHSLNALLAICSKVSFRIWLPLWRKRRNSL